MKSRRCFRHSPRSHIGDALWNSEPDSCHQFSQCFLSAFLVLRKLHFRKVLKRIIQNTSRKGPVCGTWYKFLSKDMQGVLSECDSHLIEQFDDMPFSPGAGWKSYLLSSKVNFLQGRSLKHAVPEAQVPDSAVNLNAPQVLEDIDAKKDNHISEAEFNGLSAAECYCQCQSWCCQSQSWDGKCWRKRSSSRT